MIPGKLPLDPFTEGDKWEGIPALTITINGAQPADPVTLVTMKFKLADDLPSSVVTLTSATPGQITIVDAAAWEIAIPAQTIAGLTYGKWTWRIECTDATNGARTYIADEIEVLETV